MGTLTEFKNEEIGDLLLRVHDEIKSLKSLVSKDGSKVDVKALQASLQKAEAEIKQKSDYFINQLNGQVKLIPSAKDKDEVIPAANFGATIENIWDVTKKNRVDSAGRGRFESRSLSNMNFKKENDYSQRRAYDDQTIEEIHELQGPKFTPFSLSPGQQAKATRETKALFNPENPRNRQALNENYSIQLPLIEKRGSVKMQTHVIHGSTIEHLSTLPLAYRRNPTLLPPPVNEMEATHGLLSLIQRGLIPHHAKITFEQFPIAARSIQPTPKQRESVITYKDKKFVSDHIYKLDPNYQYNRQRQNYDQNELTDIKRLKSARSKPESAHSRKSGTQRPIKEIESHPLRPPTTPMNHLQLQSYDTSKYVHKFIIQNGRVRVDLPEYSQFKSSYILRWGSIVTIIKNLEDLCQTYSVPVGYLDGQKVSELSRCIDMDLKPSLEELLDTFINKEDVENIVRSPGQIFKRKGGENLAAIKIQCAWRRFRDRRAYLAYRRRKWAAGVIALTWLTYVKMAKAREKLALTRKRHLENFKKRQLEFVKSWPKIKNSKRVIVHIPSLGFPEPVRSKMRDLQIQENYQMGRICDIGDENVDVIYVSPIAITEETLQYYSKLFGLKKSIETGEAKDLIDLTPRYKIVIPEALNSFPTHNMTLSTILKYSPKALERIKNLTKGRDAYIVPGIMNHDDLHVSDVLNLPILGCEPQIANLYSTKSGSKRIFQSAKISIPFGEFDIYNKEQLYETLAQAITENLTVQRWLFKLDDEFDGRGTAYCDISSHLSCYQWALKEMIKFGDKWGKRWAYEPTYVKILEEIPQVLEKHAQPVNKQAYFNWDEFLKCFIAQGGVIEANPPSDSVTSLTVSLLIEPDSTVKILTSGDHLHAESQYSCWGYTFPQTSAEPEIINEACLKIAEACKQRHIMGYVNVDFLTYIDSKTDEQVLWAVDLNLYYSNIISMTSLITYLTNGKFDSENHNFEVVPLNKNDFKSRRARKSADRNNYRYAAMSNKLHHSNLSVIHYSVFFQTCRALGIGYDIKEKQGTIFTIVDSLNHENMGMVTITDNLQSAMQQFSHNLDSIHHEISSEGMQGKTNFLISSQEIKSILASATEEDDEF